MLITPHLTYIPTNGYIIEDGFSIEEPIGEFDSRLIIEFDEGITIPTGLLPRFLKLNKLQHNTSIDYSYKPIKLMPNITNPNLRAYQIAAIEKALSHKRGVIKLPTGAGKSFIIGELVGHFITNGSVLIVVSSRSLLQQMRLDISTYLGISTESISSIGDGYKDMDLIQPISICTSTSLYEHRYDEILNKRLGRMPYVIFDEVHTLCNITGWTISGLLQNSSYRIGLSATPWSAKYNNLLEAITGPLLYEAPEREVIDQGYILEPRILMYMSPKTWAPHNLINRGYSPYVYNQLYKHLILNNQGRNKLIASIVKDLVDNNPHPGCVIVDRVSTNPSHPDLLIPLLDDLGIKGVPVIHGKTNSKVREEVLNNIKTGACRFAIFGPGILKEGINIPSLGWMILANAGKSDKDLIQRVGRVLRLSKDKEQPIVVDFIDQQSFFSSQSNKRQEIYRSVYGDSCIEYI